MTAPAAARTLVVGGGWAGLAAAAELALAGRPVTLLESAPQLGGRARRVRHAGRDYDNGQHLLVGACTAIDALLKRLGVDPAEAFLRLPLTLDVRDADGGGVRVAGSRPLAGRLDPAFALLRAKGLSFPQRLRALAGLLRLGLAAGTDRSVAEVLGIAIDDPLRARLWDPLALAILNTPADAGSARLLGRVLRESLMGPRGASDLLIPRLDLSALLPEPATRMIERHGGEIRLSARVVALETQNGRVAAVRTGAGERIAADGVILATPHAVAAQLQGSLDDAVARRVGALDDLPIATVYFDFAHGAALDAPLVGLVGGTLQWVFDHAPLGRPGRLAGVISGPGPHEAMTREALAAAALADLCFLRPGLPDPEAVFVTRERRATFRAAPGVDAARAACTTSIGNLWIAGDHVANGLPATLEGAVRSGLECARRALAARNE